MDPYTGADQTLNRNLDRKKKFHDSPDTAHLHCFCTLQHLALAASEPSSLLDHYCGMKSAIIGMIQKRSIGGMPT